MKITQLQKTKLILGLAIMALLLILPNLKSQACSYAFGSFPIWPGDGATAVPLNTNIIFYDVMDLVTEASDIVLTDPSGNTVSGTLEDNPKFGSAVKVFLPDTNLKRNTEYTLTIPDYDWFFSTFTFSTGINVDEEAPQIQEAMITTQTYRHDTGESSMCENGIDSHIFEIATHTSDDVSEKIFYVFSIAEVGQELDLSTIHSYELVDTGTPDTRTRIFIETNDEKTYTVAVRARDVAGHESTAFTTTVTTVTGEDGQEIVLNQLFSLDSSHPDDGDEPGSGAAATSSCALTRSSADSLIFPYGPSLFLILLIGLRFLVSHNKPQCKTRVYRNE